MKAKFVLAAFPGQEVLVTAHQTPGAYLCQLHQELSPYQAPLQLLERNRHLQRLRKFSDALSCGGAPLPSLVVKGVQGTALCPAVALQKLEASFSFNCLALD